MDKRRFLAASALGAVLPLHAGAAASTARKGVGLLTVAGAIGRSNRGPLDPALDPLLARHGAAFDKAFVFDEATLAALPSVTIQPTVEYDRRPHALRGPLLGTLLESVGVAADASAMLTLHALDGYRPTLSLAEARRYRMIVALSMDGVPMSAGGLGPLWAVYDADRLPDFKDKPLDQRFAFSPWALYCVEVKNA